MPQSLALVSFLVRDYDEALAFFTDSLGFRLVEDSPLPGGKRWLVVAPPGSTGSSLLLAQAASPEQLEQVGKQAAGRVFLFLHTDDFWRDYRLMQASDVKFLETPREESYGTVAVFEDLYGNKWDLLQPKEANVLRPMAKARESR
jgi:catechol 2,3-dioxygenase-like lactoylglutathione lyase family enzyme